MKYARKTRPCSWHNGRYDDIYLCASGPGNFIVGLVTYLKEV
jgi:hypothetical protein